MVPLYDLIDLRDTLLDQLCHLFTVLRKSFGPSLLSSTDIIFDFSLLISGHFRVIQTHGCLGNFKTVLIFASPGYVLWALIFDMQIEGLIHLLVPMIKLIIS